ncbi:hypothetical protein [Spirosoma arcticum]
MKKNWIITLMAGLWLAGCSPKDLAPASVVAPAPNEDVSALYQQFHGKYKVITSISSEALDVNLDGIASTNMMLEIPELVTGQQYYTELRIYGPSQYSSTPSFIFTQWWPEQYIRLGSQEWDGNQLLDYNSNYKVVYLNQGSYRNFSLSPDLKQITVQPDEKENPFRWVRPESVTVEEAGRLRVVNKRRLYTRAGVKEVVITTVYERYTMST